MTTGNSYDKDMIELKLSTVDEQLRDLLRAIILPAPTPCSQCGLKGHDDFPLHVVYKSVASAQNTITKALKTLRVEKTQESA
jgi:hypothetical protein